MLKVVLQLQSQIYFHADPKKMLRDNSPRSLPPRNKLYFLVVSNASN